MHQTPTHTLRRLWSISPPRLPVQWKLFHIGLWGPSKINGIVRFKNDAYVREYVFSSFFLNFASRKAGQLIILPDFWAKIFKIAHPVKYPYLIYSTEALSHLVGSALRTLPNTQIFYLVAKSPVRYVCPLMSYGLKKPTFSHEVKYVCPLMSCWIKKTYIQS